MQLKSVSERVYNKIYQSLFIFYQDIMGGSSTEKYSYGNFATCLWWVTILSADQFNPNHTTKISVPKRPAQAFQIQKLYIIQIVLDLPNFLTEYGACVQKNITNKIIPVRNQFSC